MYFRKIEIADQWKDYSSDFYELIKDLLGSESSQNKN